MKGLNLANSSTINERKASDFYPTPPDVTQALINTGLIPKGCIWEPACGEGHMSDVFRSNGYNVVATDINASNACFVPIDFLNDPSPFKEGDVPPIVTNPPFNLSTGFIQRSFDLGSPVTALLLKSQYWHSQKRMLLFEKYPPAYILALTWRPDFCFGERGGAPTMECLWTVWIQGQTDTRYRLLKK